MEKTILITGGLGFVGKNCIKKFEKKYNIVVLDNFSSGDKRFVSKKITIINKDIKKNLESIFKKFKFEIVIHSAANFANQNSIENISKDLNSNIVGTVNLLNFSKKYKVKKFIYFSSSCIYDQNYSSENIKNPSTKTPYAISKFSAEQYVSFFKNYYKLNVTILRLYNVYGMFDYVGRYRNVIPNFIKLAFKNKNLKIHGKGKSQRDFTFVDDLMKVLQKVISAKREYNNIYNIGPSKPITILALAKKIIKFTSSKSKIEFIAARNWDKFSLRKANNKRFKKDFNNFKFTGIDQGLKKTINWSKKNKS